MRCDTNAARLLIFAKRLPGRIAYDERLRMLLNRPGRREAALAEHGAIEVAA